MKTYNTELTNISTGVNIKRRYPITERHVGFPEQMAANAFRKNYIHPADLNFTDGPPPGAPAAVKPKPVRTLDIIVALRKRVE